MEQQVCSKCHVGYPTTHFAKWSRQCRLCKNAKQREQRAKLNNLYTKKYEKTPKGFLMRVYRNMQSRVTGVQKKGLHLYMGLELLPREAFYTWAWDNAEFWRLYKQWVMSGYSRRLTPSINRIDSNLGYTLGNVEWVTCSVNSTLGNYSPKRNNKNSLIDVFEYAVKQS